MSARSSDGLSAWQHEARALLESGGDARLKLDAYALLSAKCCASKELQNSVGALLRERSSAASDRKLLDIVFDDIQASDKTIRLAAVRLICQVAYENLLNQDSVVQLANGFSVGWIHVFSIPQSFQEQYAADCAAVSRPQTARGLREFLKRAVVANYAPIYSHVSSYYRGGCRSFLPLAWHFPAASASEAGTSIADPASHLVGFYLVPRQTQFPEQDDFYSDELLGAMDAGDVDRIQRVHLSFMAIAAQRDGGGTVLKSVLVRALRSSRDLRWALGDAAAANDDDDGGSSNALSDGEKEPVASICQYFVQENAADPSLLAWNEVLVYCCMRINAEKLRTAFGAETYAELVDLFRQLSLDVASTPAESDPLSRAVCSGTYVWEAVLVGAIQTHPTLPDTLKRHVANFQRGLYQQTSGSGTQESGNRLREPWRHLLALRLDQIQPLSWSLFLTQWRVAADTSHTLENPQRRATTVCSVSSIRRSMVAMDPRSFQSLDELRQELPNICRSQHSDMESSVQESASAVGVSDDDGSYEHGTGSDHHFSDWRTRSLYNKEDAPIQQEREEAAPHGSLAHYQQLFHKMQHSPSNLDQLSLQQLQEKQAAVARLQESVTNNKKRLADEAKRKRLTVEERYREQDGKLEELERRKAEARSSVHQKQTVRHDMVMRRRQQQLAQDEAKQQALMAQIELAQLEFHRLKEAKELAKKKRQPPPPCHEEPIALPSRPQPSAAGPSASHRNGAKRPLSARNPAKASPPTAALPPPEIIRQRAQMYGDVVSKIYLAEASSRPQPPPLAGSATPSTQSPHLVRRFSHFREQSAVATSSNNAELEQQQQQQMSVTEPTLKREWKFHNSNSNNPKRPTSVLTRDDEQSSGVKVDGISSACTTLVMRNAALAVSERISIPTIPAPVAMEPRVPAYVIEAQYSALDSHHKLKFRERFNLKSISHRLSYTVLKQFTKIVRRDTAWEEFHAAAARSNSGRASEKLRHADFVLVAQQLGIALSAKKLLLVARHLDENKNGFVDWKSFYAWWSAQYEDAFVPSRSS